MARKGSNNEPETAELVGMSVKDFADKVVTNTSMIQQYCMQFMKGGGKYSGSEAKGSDDA